MYSWQKGTAAGEVTRNGLIAEYHFDGGANDSSGNGNNGIVSGATFIDGKYGKALSFNGVDNRVRIPNSMSLNPVGGITLEAWINAKGTTTTWQSIISKMESATQNSGYELYVLQQNMPRFAVVTNDPKIGKPIKVRVGETSGNTRGDSGPPSSSYNPPAQSGSTTSPDTWIHVAGTYDGKMLVLYINGKFDSFVEKSGFLTTSTKDDLWIGSWKDVDYFKGDIDEVRIYNRALTDVEVKANYEAAPAVETPAPTPEIIVTDQPTATESLQTATPTPAISSVQLAESDQDSAAAPKASGFEVTMILIGVTSAFLMARRN